MRIKKFMSDEICVNRIYLLTFYKQISKKNGLNEVPPVS